MLERSKTEGEDRESRDLLTDLIRTGAQQLIAQALQAEVADLMAVYTERRDAQGRAGVVRNGSHPARDIQTSLGPVTVRVPKVRSRQGEPVTFHSALVPPYVRKTASFEAAIPWLYLKGISTGEMQPALEALVGPEAKGLSASTVARLKQVCERNMRLGGSSVWMPPNGSTSGSMGSIVACERSSSACVRWS